MNTGQAFRGKWLEKLVMQANEYYDQKGFGIITRVHEHKIMAGGRLVYPEKSTVDFVGVSQGRFIAFDCKAFEGGRINIANFLAHQKKYLEKIEIQGGVGFFLVANRESAWVLPIKSFPMPGKSITVAGLDEIGIRLAGYMKKIPLINYLPLVEKML